MTTSGGTTPVWIHPVGWDRFQHYGDRPTTPWIKAYTTLMSKDEFLDLSFHLRGVLLSIWLTYSTSNRQLSDRTATLHRHFGQRVSRRDLERLSDAGFIVLSASKVLAQRREEERREEKKEQEPATAAPLALVKKEPKERKPRQPDPLWDVLVEVFGAEAAGLERGRWNKALASIREAGGTPEQLRAAAVAYREHEMFGRLTMTPTAIASNWTLLTAAPKTEIDFRNERLLAYIAEQQKGAQA